MRNAGLEEAQAGIKIAWRCEGEACGARRVSNEGPALITEAKGDVLEKAMLE